MHPTDNPYTPSDMPPQHGPSGTWEFNHSRAIKYVFDNPNWMTNVLLTLVCMMIPLVGPIVVYGYQFEIIESLHKSRGRWYPDFDFNRFTEYLSRGIWVFLIAMIINVIAIPFIWIIAVAGMALIGVVVSALGPDTGPLSLFGTIPLFILIMSCFWMVIAIVSAPFVLRTGLTQDFGEGFNMSFAREFIGNTWKQIAASTIFMFFFSFVATLAGMVVLCVGMYVAIAYLTLVMSHIGWQTYELHLSKGGTPIPIKSSVPRPVHGHHPQPPVKQPPHRPY
jgi:hypothetical protein